MWITSKEFQKNIIYKWVFEYNEKIFKCNSDEILSPADMGFVVNPLKVKI